MASSHRAGTSFSSGADRWLVLAGAGLLVLGLVLRLLTDIGRSTAAVDTVPPAADSAAAAPAPALAAADSATPAPALAESTAAASLGATSERRERAEPSPAAIPAARPKPSAPAVLPPPKAATTASAATIGAPAAAPDGWRVQLGVFGQAANAEKLTRQVEALGYRGEITPVGERLRVRAVGLPDEAAARAAADSIAAALGVRGSLLAPGR